MANKATPVSGAAQQQTGIVQHGENAPLSDEIKATMRDILCDSACAFSDHCDGWRYAPYCMLMDSGVYPEYLKD